jgi:ABC-type uncharacterized transport system ATPase subunit
MTESIVIEDLTKYYGKFLALDSLSLRVEENSNIGLVAYSMTGYMVVLFLASLWISRRRQLA